MARMTRTVMIALGVVLLGAMAVAGAAEARGYGVYAVRTGSMTPSYPVGALVVDAPPTPTAVRTGSVLTFRVGGALVTHRVVGTSAAGLTTKGDANPAPDAWTIPATNVVGRVVAGVPRAGYVLVFLKQPTGPLALMAGAVSLIALWRLFFGAEGADPAAAGPQRRRPSHRAASSRRPRAAPVQGTV